MNTKRSYLDTLNAGRRRRPVTGGDLDRTLADLEGRRQAEERLEHYRDRDEGWLTRRPSSEMPFPRERAMESHERPAPRQALRDFASDVARARQQEDGYNSVSRIAAELKAMRDELRQQTSAGLQQEFESLRRDIQRLAANAQSVQPREIGVEFERLSDAIHSLSERADDRSINLLRLELEEVKSALDTLAREDTVKSVDRRWDDFDRRWSAFESRQERVPDLSTLGAQIERIATTVNSLPESLSLRSLEDKVRVLAHSMEQIVQHQSGIGPQALSMIEQRLDEISRAIVTSSLSAQPVSFDPEPFERIEARVSSLARQIDELVEERPSAAVIDHLNLLSSRVDEIAHRIELPEAMVERLADQMALISSKLDRDPPPADMDIVFRNLENRFEHLSSMLEKRQDDALEQGQILFHELERRLEQVADRLEQRPALAPEASRDVMDAIDRRFAELARHLEHAPGDTAIQGLEDRLEDISRRIEQSSMQATGLDPAIISALEAQVAGLSAHLSRPGATLPEFDDIGSRLGQIEQAIAGSRETVLETARKVAEDAARSIASAPADLPIVAELTAELRALDALTRKSDERNARTFEAIHDTLLKIVDRLGVLENGGRGYEIAPAHGMEARPVLSPAEAAAAAANHAEQLDATVAAVNNPPRSMLGSLARAFGGRKEQIETGPAIEPEAPSLDVPAPGVDEPLDPKLANQPLEPGSGAPDINAIMRRVRDERGQPASGTSGEAAKSDFIAAARRAAQAAAAEAELTKRGADATGPIGKSRIGGLFKARRKMMLLAATGILVVLGGMQLGKAFLSDDGVKAQVAQSRPEPSLTAEMMQVPDEPLPSTAEAAREDTVQARMVDEMPGAAPTETASLPQDVPPMPSADSLTTNGTPPADAEASALAAPDAGDSLSPAEAHIPAPADVGPEALREAANSGDPKAMYEIGSRYAEGRSVKQDMKKAADWYEQAAELGFAPAQYRIGNFYEKGTGVERDIEQSKHWYRQAAAQGNAGAMHNLAVLLAMGAGEQADHSEAARWFLEAAELGVKDSQFNLGILSAKGAGMPQSLEESYKWFALVAQSGDRDAASKRDEVAKALRPDQLEKAKAAAELWKPRTVNPETNTVDIPEEWTEDTIKTASVDMKQAVTNIQAILNKNGYDAGPADGMMGKRTRDAIAAFQKDNGMNASGDVTEELVKALLARR